ncbi:MAG: 4Fe-4S binding protein [Acetatifactor sp.]|nr:4Fe-4S binding protein [Acetatifactor sp.]
MECVLISCCNLDIYNKQIAKGWGCKLCYSVCPQKCIDISGKPVVIDRNCCLHCGQCAEICPKQVIGKRS